MKENVIERHLVKECRKRRWKAVKTVAVAEPGYPDRTVLATHGVEVKIELKAPGRKLSKQQHIWRAELESRGLWWECADSIEDVDEIVRKIEKAVKRCSE